MRPDEVRQRSYYRDTAASYDDLHTADSDEHYFALRHIVLYLEWIEAASVLDTGCGTGRAMKYVKERLPHISVRGNDPSSDLLRIAVEDHGISHELLDCAASEQLPYQDGSFDAVIETGVLHHTPNPAAVVAEMLRVAEKAIFISDANIYGQGAFTARVAKLVLSRVGLLRPLSSLRRGGHDWYYTDEDGVAYSYSLFDAYGALADSCEQIIVIPTSGGTGVIPMLTSPHALLCGFKKRIIGRP